MDNQLFYRLTTSMQQMNEIDAGYLALSRITEVKPSSTAAASGINGCSINNTETSCININTRLEKK